jgi:hypothetical protein
MNTTTWMLMILTFVQGLAAGICVDVALVKLPTRHKIGSIAYANFARGNDLGNGLKVYPYLVVGGGVIIIVFTAIAHFNKIPSSIMYPLYAAALSAFGYLLSTAKAAPVMWSIKTTPNEETILKNKLDRFAFWHIFRTVFQIAAFLALLWALSDTNAIAYVLAAFLHGLAAGLCFDTALVKLPTRHRIGVIPYANFARGNDLGNGIVVYPSLAISAALLLFAVTINAFIKDQPSQVLYSLYVASFATLLAFVGTGKAAPVMLSLKSTPNEERILTQKLNKFARWNQFRTVFQIIAFVALMSALVLG